MAHLPEENSMFQHLLQRFRRKRLAMGALVFVLLIILLGIFGYAIAPDNTRDANFQTVEIQAKPMGYRQLFLRMDRSASESFTGLDPLFFGKEFHETWIPITAFAIQGNQLMIDKYVEDGVIEKRSIPLSEWHSGGGFSVQQYIRVKRYWLGTDKFGRDILSRLIIGTRVSLLVGLFAVVISMTLGIFLGALAGYYRGWIDEIIQWVINVTWSIPTLLLVFAFTLAMGKGFWQIFIAVGLTMWVSVARLIRGQVIALKEQEYVQAAKVLGFTDARIILKHILPNILGPVIVLAASNFASAIIVEAGLSFLGIGIQPPQPSWGLMIKENYNFIITHHPLPALIPGAAIMLLVLSINLVGNGLRDALDVKN